MHGTEYLYENARCLAALVISNSGIHSHLSINHNIIVSVIKNQPEWNHKQQSYYYELHILKNNRNNHAARCNPV